MNDKEFDIEKFIDLFDTAMTSDNPTVRRAFKNLLIVAALIDSETPPKASGPLRGLYNQIDDLRNRISKIEISKYQQNTVYGPVTTTGGNGAYPSTNAIPTWINSMPTIKYTLDESTAVSTNPYMTTTIDTIYNGLNNGNE